MHPIARLLNKYKMQNAEFGECREEKFRRYMNPMTYESFEQCLSKIFMEREHLLGCIRCSLNSKQKSAASKTRSLVLNRKVA